jgi:hypothetical protein
MKERKTYKVRISELLYQMLRVRVSEEKGIYLYEDETFFEPGYRKVVLTFYGKEADHVRILIEILSS